MKPYIVKVPKVVWAADDIDALDKAKTEFGARPKKAKEHHLSHVPREWFDIANTTQWLARGTRFVDFDGSRWFGDGHCMVRMGAGADVGDAKDSTGEGAPYIRKHLKTAKSAPYQRKRTHCLVGGAIIDLRFARVVEHFFGDVDEWRCINDKTPVFAMRVGKPVALVAPMLAPPDDTEAFELRMSLERAQFDLRGLRETIAQKRKIAAAVAELPDLERAKRESDDRFFEASRLAGLAPIIPTAADKEAALVARIDALTAKIAAHDSEAA